jgi:hypothetical protein
LELRGPRQMSELGGSGQCALTFNKRGICEMAHARTYCVLAVHLMFALKNEGAFRVVAGLRS